MTLVYCFVTLTGRSSRLSLVKPPARLRRLPSQPLSADRRERSFPRVEVSIFYIYIYIFNRTDFIHEMTTVCSQPDGFCVAPSVLLCLRHQVCRPDYSSVFTTCDMMLTPPCHQPTTVFSVAGLVTTPVSHCVGFWTVGSMQTASHWLSHWLTVNLAASPSHCALSRAVVVTLNSLCHRACKFRLAARYKTSRLISDAGDPDSFYILERVHWHGPLWAGLA